MTTETNRCPICKRVSNENEIRDKVINCHICGNYSITTEAVDYLKDIQINDDKRFIFKHYMAKNQLKEIKKEILVTIADNTVIPDLIEQINGLILEIGNATKTVGYYTNINERIAYKIGVDGLTSASGMIDLMVKESLIESKNKSQRIGSDSLTLTLKGIRKYVELKENKISSKTVFMAMDYGNNSVDKFVNNGIRPIIEKLGLNLHILRSEGLRAGILDDHLRVDVRSSKFLIADVTTQNKNVYWEAGFAEGLGKKVIFTCSDETFETSIKSVFNINHIRAVKWNTSKYSDATDELSSIIKNTFHDLI